MRLPPMTTRRWMVAVAAIAIAFGAYVWASRLNTGATSFLRGRSGTRNRKLITAAWSRIPRAALF